MVEELKIIVADDQERVRYGLRALLRQQPGWQVIGEAETTQQLLALVSVLHPDLVLLDWHLPDLPGEAVLSSLHNIHRDLPVIILSGHIDAKTKALDAGADAFVSKANSPDELVETIRRVMAKQKIEE